MVLYPIIKHNLLLTGLHKEKKYNFDGTLSYYKAQLVAYRFTQREGIDYFETYSPIIKITTLCVLQTIATIFNLYIHQMDIITTFLYRDLEEELYINP